MADCHPDQRHYAKGYCQTCYEKHRWTQIKSDQQLHINRKVINNRATAKWLKANPWYLQTDEYKDKACKRTKEYRDTHPERTERTDRIKHLRRKYGITLEKYNELHIQQNGCCALCKKPERVSNGLGRKVSSLAVDHCHKTGRIRGLLCFRCNTSIAQIENENIVGLIENYLREQK